MKPFRSLFTRVFLWFWATLTVGSVVILSVTLLTGSQPFGARWMRLTQDLYAHSAVSFYTTGGPTALAQYLHKLDQGGMSAALLTADAQDVLTHADHSQLHIVTHAKSAGHSVLEPGRITRAVSVVDSGPTRFYFLIEVHPENFVDGTFFRPALLRITLAIAIAGLFSFILARSLTRPIQKLQTAATSIASGQLSTRVTPLIQTRHTELAETARAFDSMAEQLEHMLRARDQLLADISHELRSPLTRLSVSFELVRRGELDLLDRIDRDLERMNGLISQLLHLSRLDTQKPSLKPIHLRPLIASIHDDAQLEGSPENKSITLTGPLDFTLQADPDLLRSGLENIVRNALRFTPPDSTVNITVGIQAAPATTPHHITITVLDSGPGVPSAHLASLTEPFFQVAQARTPGAHSGLGLSIAQRAITLHNGTLTIANRDDAPGLAVTVTLPATPSM